jgi:hypothetical protein
MNIDTILEDHWKRILDLKQEGVHTYSFSNFMKFNL